MFMIIKVMKITTTIVIKSTTRIIITNIIKMIRIIKKHGS